MSIVHSLSLLCRRTARRKRPRPRLVLRRRLRVECLESRMLLSADLPADAPELPEDSSTCVATASAEMLVADISPGSDSATDESVMAESNGAVPLDSMPLLAPEEMTGISSSSIAELQVDTQGVVQGTVIADGLLACRQVELDVNSDGLADLYTFTNESNSFRFDLSELLGPGQHTVQARTVDASGVLDGAWRAITFECQVSLQADTAAASAVASPAAAAVSDLVAIPSGDPLNEGGNAGQVLEVTSPEGEGSLGAPLGDPGGSIPGTAPTAPVLTSFNAMAGWGGVWMFTGTVQHERPDTLTVQFGGLLEGSSVSVMWNGTFLFSKMLAPDVNGVVSAQAFDPNGVGSNIAYRWI
jgi:hypothetical protein